MINITEPRRALEPLWFLISGNRALARPQGANMDQQQTAASLDQSIGEGPTVSQEPNTAQANSFWWDLLFWVTMCIPV